MRDAPQDGSVQRADRKARRKDAEWSGNGNLFLWVAAANDVTEVRTRVD